VAIVPTVPAPRQISTRDLEVTCREAIVTAVRYFIFEKLEPCLAALFSAQRWETTLTPPMLAPNQLLGTCTPLLLVFEAAVGDIMIRGLQAALVRDWFPGLHLCRALENGADHFGHGIRSLNGLAHENHRSIISPKSGDRY
jgi:hypothetical protein